MLLRIFGLAIRDWPYYLLAATVVPQPCVQDRALVLHSGCPDLTPTSVCPTPVPAPTCPLSRCLFIGLSNFVFVSHQLPMIPPVLMPLAAWDAWPPSNQGFAIWPSPVLGLNYPDPVCPLSAWPSVHPSPIIGVLCLTQCVCRLYSHARFSKKSGHLSHQADALPLPACTWRPVLHDTVPAIPLNSPFDPSSPHAPDSHTPLQYLPPWNINGMELPSITLVLFL